MTSTMDLIISAEKRRRRDREYIRTDKNGTKYYNVWRPCPRCGGAGGSDAWAYTGWTCYACGGNGDGGYVTEKEYTPEYEAKLAEKREKAEARKRAKAEAELPKKRAAWLADRAWSEDGFTYLFLGNTYERKEEIKAAGGKYDAIMGWHIAFPVDGFELLKVTKAEALVETDFGYMLRDDVNFAALKRAEEKRLHPVESTSEYQGSVKERLKDLRLTISFETTFDKRQYSYYDSCVTWFYSMTDEAGNIFTWNASAPIVVDGKQAVKGDRITITGTVKEHKEYKGDKQTVLTRCKVSAIG